MKLPFLVFLMEAEFCFAFNVCILYVCIKFNIPTPCILVYLAFMAIYSPSVSPYTTRDYGEHQVAWSKLWTNTILCSIFALHLIIHRLASLLAHIVHSWAMVSWFRQSREPCQLSSEDDPKQWTLRVHLWQSGEVKNHPQINESGPVNKLDAHAKCRSQTVQCKTSVRL